MSLCITPLNVHNEETEILRSQNMSLKSGLYGVANVDHVDIFGFINRTPTVDIPVPAGYSFITRSLTLGVGITLSVDTDSEVIII